MNKFLIVCQTTPPYLGQSIMNDMFLAQTPPFIDYVHLRPLFSQRSTDFGKLTLSKILSILSFYWLFATSMFKNYDFIILQPSGPVNKHTILKDMFPHLLAKLFRKKRIYYFHSSNFNRGLYYRGIWKWLFKFIYKPYF